jgi:hypothetical protein
LGGSQQYRAAMMIKHNFLLLLTLLVTVIGAQDELPSVNTYECIHSEIQMDIPKHFDINNDDNDEKRSIHQEHFAPMRIHLIEDDSIQNDSFVLGLIDNSSSPFWQAVNTLSKALMVRPIADNSISPRCDYFTEGINTGYCIDGTVRRTCNNIFDVPYELSSPVIACESANSSCYVDGNTTGIDTDFILIVGTSGYCDYNRNVIAFAAACDIDSYLRPSSGLMAICTNNIFSRASFVLNIDHLLYSIIAHELTHAFGFSAQLYPYYRHHHILTYDGELNVYGLNSSQVNEQAEEYFDCPSVDYLPLSRDLSHWEPQVLFHEVMIPYILPDYLVYSNFTLKYFNDSGWYRVNFTITNAIDQFDMKWGEGKGCQFIDGSCIDETNCTSISSSQCTFDHLSKGFCTDVSTDCPMSFPITSCIYHYYHNIDNTSTPFEVHQKYGKQSRCFEVIPPMSCDHTPTCYETIIYQYNGTGDLAYQIVGSSGEPVWCRENTYIEISDYTVFCPSIDIITLHTKPQDIIITNDVPPPLCHSSCATCLAVNDPSQCITCHRNNTVTLNSPSDCSINVTRNIVTDCFQACSNGSVRLTGENSNIVELCNGTQWLPLCYDTLWDYRDAIVLCRGIGLDSDGAFVGSIESTDLHPGVGNVKCTGNEGSLASCDYDTLDQCSSGKLATAYCVPGITDCSTCYKDITCYMDGRMIDDINVLVSY